MVRSLRPQAIFPITTRRLSVIRVADVTPGMRRVTLGGEELAAHVASNGFKVAAFRSEGFDDEFKLILPNQETGEFAAPTQAEGTLNWPAGAFTDTRTYTVRRWDPGVGEIDVDVVKHGSGPATTWAYSCAPGDALHVAGPKMSHGHADVGWLLIAGDETALPAIARWLEELPAGAKAEVFIEVGEADHVQEIRTAADATITWLSRDGAPAGTTSLLLDALQAAPWHSDDVYAWVAGETLTLTPIRRWLRNDKGLPRERVEVAGYWRRKAVEGEADETGQEAPAEDAAHTLHELLEVVPGIALRVASTLGVFRELAQTPQSVNDLAAAVGADPRALERLLRYLAEIDIVERTEGILWATTDLGSELDSERYADELDLRTADGREILGITGLLDAVITGASGHEAHHGRSFADVVAGDPTLAASRLHSGLVEWTETPLSLSTQLAPLRDLRVAGPGSGTLALALAKALPDIRLRLLLPPSQIAAAEQLEWPDRERVTFEAGSVLDRRPERAEAQLLLGVLSELGDADAIHVLAEAAASTHDGTVLVFEDALVPELAGEHDYEHDLALLATHGGEMRTDEQLSVLAERAGLHLVERETIGWGFALRRYVTH